MKTNVPTDSPETRTPTLRYASLGSVSHDTLRTEDLLEAFGDQLDWHLRRNEDYFDLAENRAQRDTWAELLHEAATLANTDDASEVIADLIDALQFFARPYCYFGAHPGDGADFGFWASFDAIDELPTVADSDEAKALGEDCKSANDHGNLTVYGGDGSIILELV